MNQTPLELAQTLFMEGTNEENARGFLNVAYQDGHAVQKAIQTVYHAQSVAPEPIVTESNDDAACRTKTFCRPLSITSNGIRWRVSRTFRTVLTGEIELTDEEAGLFADRAIQQRCPVVQPDQNGEFPRPVDGALWMASRGIPQAPLRPNTKDAFLPDWPSKATRDSKQIMQWWNEYPGCNFGSVALQGGPFVFEADKPAGRRQTDTRQVRADRATLHQPVHHPVQSRARGIAGICTARGLKTLAKKPRNITISAFA